MLDAAAALFADADSPQAVTMDAIAAKAGTGKGTLFRAFGNREGLLRELWARKLAALRSGVEKGDPPLGPGALPQERAVAFLDALLLFKLKNRHLIRALEFGPGLLQSEHYRWMHGLLQHFIERAARAITEDDAGYAAHVLLAAIHIDLVEDMMAGGLSPASIRQAQAAHVRALISNARRRR
ncbi:TetR/AcrR family transcriptional regulator [Silvibacterium dinghuense]|uniref:TetR/AcrR family transcriptional regulator n=1 Tax=Silvibacterium dinghuense TaxID=1560006 RepID=A0A4V1NUX7_9BACT|nr:TetR/AcrR family transcriptional regulator [Silvibacterium dinghuense]RXS93794.1 TetR/AcrR family transcriptional regulator [Silvibacterium dinghuense]GGH07697.1 hypothetical protein GCM10011586_25010 [Silvibacterium dinghuense]